ncbi:PadR family transcriptional regulator [Thermosporothrix hazakensis]|jgi:DNA-binding PadR family transcriptional regulator|uniref:PadR family transcriptional regulator n=2 Tax=Thermosporothrix TaxID=768650 RepID=A0A326U546_THEHA|nr:PadR family transcriptional regulator [Thermosporothrix hazakensis]PZW27455.1 PadR family transcriptional regulator [Thermosporothrix hazakensis]BBH85953.1 PadR family transcriptional regulator [Thermosporothrix sp. COM3]GCE45621.1 PadR family transcriptional regulator [Thermosporothrix hazakensis]
MHYELIILGVLMLHPAHGYKISKVIQKATGPFTRISHGRLYPLLNKMQKEGLIICLENEGSGERQARKYQITDAGRKRFHDLLMDTRSHQYDYQRFFLQKVAWFPFLPPEEQLFLVEDYIEYCQKHIEHYSEKVGALCRNELPPVLSQHALTMSNHSLKQWKLELAWAQELRAEIQNELQARTQT